MTTTKTHNNEDVHIISMRCRNIGTRSFGSCGGRDCSVSARDSVTGDRGLPLKLLSSQSSSWPPSLSSPLVASLSSSLLSLVLDAQLPDENSNSSAIQFGELQPQRPAQMRPLRSSRMRSRRGGVDVSLLLVLWRRSLISARVRFRKGEIAGVEGTSVVMSLTVSDKRDGYTCASGSFHGQRELWNGQRELWNELNGAVDDGRANRLLCAAIQPRVGGVEAVEGKCGRGPWCQRGRPALARVRPPFRMQLARKVE